MLPDPLDPPFTDDDLEAYLAWEDENDALETGEPQGEGREPFPTPVVAWSVCDTGSAEWAMRKLAHSTAAAVEIKAQANRFFQQIEQWAEAQLRPLDRSANFFAGQLESYARRQREEDGVKTLKLPSGEVASRLNPARPKVDLEQEFVAWARRDLPAAVKAKWSPVMAEVKDAVKFEVVRVPDFVSDDLVLVRWPSAEGETVWVAVPSSMVDGIPGRSGPDESTIAAEDLPNFHDEVWPIFQGHRVPGVTLVPEEITYTVKPALP